MTSDLISVRAAAPADVAWCRQLLHDHDDAVRSERGGRWHLDHDLVDDQPWPAPDDHLVVGCIDDAVVGFGRAHLSPASTGEVLAVVSELVVHPDARSIGVGSAVLAAIEAWAVSNGCAAIESHVLPGNRAAKNFFERVGMKTRKMRVSADLT